MENARVLPLPVFPRPSTSRPERVSGRGVDLDRERRSDSAVFESFHQRCAHTEGCEGGSGRRDVRQVCSEPFGHVFVPGCRHGN